MKPIFRFSIILIIQYFLIAYQSNSQIPDCMCVPLSYPQTGQIINLDSSIVFDTCGVQYKYSNCDSSFWYNLKSDYGEQAKKKVYSKGYWVILFEVSAIPIPAAPKEDTLIYVDWTAIDTAYPEIRNTFQQMEENFGDLYFRKMSPTAGENAKNFRLYFTNYVNIDSITTIGSQISGIKVFDYGSWPAIQQNIPNDKSMIPRTDISEIHQNGLPLSDDYKTPKNFHKLGFAFHNYL
jgi:hypothetical protein